MPYKTSGRGCVKYLSSSTVYWLVSMVTSSIYSFYVILILSVSRCIQFVVGEKKLFVRILVLHRCNSASTMLFGHWSVLDWFNNSSYVVKQWHRNGVYNGLLRCNCIFNNWSFHSVLLLGERDVFKQIRMIF